MRDHLAQIGREPLLWVAGSAAERERLECLVAEPGKALAGAMVRSWDDLWTAVAGLAPAPPARLSRAGASRCLMEAIGRLRGQSVLDRVAAIVDTAGYRRQVRDRIGSWTRAGVDPSDWTAADVASVRDAAELAIFREYRLLLRAIGPAVDHEGFVHWAADRLDARALLKAVGNPVCVVLVDPPGQDMGVQRAVERFCATDLPVHATLEWSEEQTEAFTVTKAWRNTLLGFGFEESSVAPDTRSRPVLAELESRIFRDDVAPIEPDGSITVVGAPAGEGLAIEVARFVKQRIGVDGSPSDLAVVVPYWDDQADLILQALREWEIPATTCASRCLALDPAVSTLMQALRLPAEGWDSQALARLLRNRQLRPSWNGPRTPLDLAEAACSALETGTIRGRVALERALEITATTPPDTRHAAIRLERDRQKRHAASQALDVIRCLSKVLERDEAEATWAEHLGHLEFVARSLGLEPDPGRTPHAILALVQALEDEGEVLDRLGRGGDRISLDAFLAAVESRIREEHVAPPSVQEAAVLVTTPGRGTPGTVSHVVIANLIEGTFPAREAIEADSAAAGAGYAAEMLRFLRILGAAGSSLCLIYPTVDVKGQALLHSGFLDELRQALDPGSWGTIAREERRHTPVPKGDRLWGSPRERRVQAVALALEQRLQAGSFEELAGRPGHREALAGSALALGLARVRSDRNPFGIHEGCFSNKAALQRVAVMFGESPPSFSPSQLESYAFCPFQFLMRFVLRLEAVQAPDEFEEPAQERGNLLHRALQSLHVRLDSETDIDPAELPDRVRAEVVDEILREMQKLRSPATPLDDSLRRIREAHYTRAGLDYAQQFARYHEERSLPGLQASTHPEVAFGPLDTYEGVALGQGQDRVLIHGRVDRVDVYPRADGVKLFRVIDYKTGRSPEKKEIEAGTRLQLPIYAIAVQRSMLADDISAPIEVGYWALQGDGFKPAWTMLQDQDLAGPISTEEWERDQRRFETYVLDLVRSIRAGAFPVAPASDHCESFCGFRTVCRIRQVRRSAKTWAERPVLGPREDGPG